MKKFILTTTIAILSSAVYAQTAATDFKSVCEQAKSFQSAKVTYATYTKGGAIHVGFPFPPTVTTNVPDHCLIRGKINERVGKDGKNYWIGYELRLPEKWNGKFFFQGGGGTDGILRPAFGNMRGEQPSNALTIGYAVVSTDAGHLNEQGPIGDYLFGLDPQARIDKGHYHLPTVTNVSKGLIKQVYGKPPKYSYFMGCSNGGRQGMMASQHYPELFDGIIAMAPAHRVPLAAAEGNYHNQLLASIAPKNSDNSIDFGSALTPEDMNLFAKAITDKCDADDGLKDGLIFNTKSCKFDPKVLTCLGGNTASCLPQAKVAVLEKMFAGAKNSKGETIYSNWPYDNGVNHPAWRAWRLGTPKAMPANARNVTLIPGSLAYVFSAPPEQPTDLIKYSLEYNFDRDPPKLWAKTKGFQGGMWFEAADSVNVDKYVQKGGKIIYFHGMADPIFSAYETINYVDALQGRYGKKTHDFSRLYLIPGLTHCGSGLTTDVFNLLEPLENWVEKKQAPQSVIASVKATSNHPFANRTRPLCPYPTTATYKGSGDSEKAENFVCK